MDHALDGVEYPRYSCDKLMGTRTRYNDRVLMFILRNRASKRCAAGGGPKGLNATGQMQHARFKTEWRKEWEGKRPRVSIDEVGRASTAGSRRSAAAPFSEFVRPRELMVMTLSSAGGRRRFWQLVPCGAGSASPGIPTTCAGHAMAFSPSDHPKMLNERSSGAKTRTRRSTALVFTSKCDSATS